MEYSSDGTGYRNMFIDMDFLSFVKDLSLKFQTRDLFAGKAEHFGKDLSYLSVSRTVIFFLCQCDCKFFIHKHFQKEALGLFV